MVEGFGAKFNYMREARRLALKPLADQVGCTGAHLSQIENGHTSSSSATWKRIGEAIGVNIVDFFSDEGKVGARGHIRSREARRVRTQLERQGPAARPVSRIKWIHTVASKGGGSHKPDNHAGEEFGIVFRGTLSIPAGGTVHRAGPGESFVLSLGCSPPMGERWE